MAKAQPASAVAVVDFDANWDLSNNSGQIRIKLQRGQPIVLQNINNAAEYLAVLTLLQSQKTVFAKGRATLTTAP